MQWLSKNVTRREGQISCEQNTNRRSDQNIYVKFHYSQMTAVNPQYVGYDESDSLIKEMAGW